MKARDVADLPDVWLLVEEGPPGLLYLRESFPTQRQALAAWRRWKRETRHIKHLREDLCWRYREYGVVKDEPRVRLCHGDSFIRDPADLTIRENWIARNEPLLVEARRHVCYTTVYTWKAGRSRDPLVPRSQGPAPLPPGEEWPGCHRCGASLAHIGTLDFRHTPQRRHMPGDVLVFFYCNQCGWAEQIVRLIWLHARRKNRLVRPPRGHPADSRLGVPWRVRDFRWSDVHRFWQLEGITNTVAGRSFYTMVAAWGDKIGGYPSWIQGDDTPRCRCRRRMRFACQFVGRGDDIDFGDSGLAYVFVCAAARCGQTKCIFQCF